VTLPTREEADAVLARQPWVRVCKELTLFVTLLSGTPEGAAEVTRQTVEVARGELWSFFERPLWAVLTDAAGGTLASPEARQRAAAEVVRIPLLGTEELDRELRAKGLSPEGLSGLGARIKGETAERARATAADAARARSRVRGDGKPQRPEMPTLSRAPWAALSMVVLVTAALALLGAITASQHL
jgi:hypothetical protein